MGGLIHTVVNNKHRYQKSENAFPDIMDDISSTQMRSLVKVSITIVSQNRTRRKCPSRTCSGNESNFFFERIIQCCHVSFQEGNPAGSSSPDPTERPVRKWDYPVLFMSRSLSPKMLCMINGIFRIGSGVSQIFPDMGKSVLNVWSHQFSEYSWTRAYLHWTSDHDLSAYQFSKRGWIWPYL